MKDNRTKQICEECNSHIIVYEQTGIVLYECSYCGFVPEDIEIFNYEEDE